MYAQNKKEYTEKKRKLGDKEDNKAATTSIEIAVCDDLHFVQKYY
jgi:hypothetical protein